MKLSTIRLVVLAAGGQVLCSWNNGEGDISGTVSTTRSIWSCPVARGEDAQPFGRPGGPFGPFGPQFNPPFPEVPAIATTRAGPIVAIFSDAGTVTTKTGIIIEIGPTRDARGPVITRIIWPGPQPSNGWGWSAGTPTKTTTIHGPAPTNPNNEPWSDWREPSHTSDSSTSTKTSTSSGSISSASGSSVFTPTSTTSGNNGVGPIGGSPSSTSTSSISQSISSATSTSSISSVDPSGGPTSALSTSPQSTFSTSFTASLSPSSTSSGSTSTTSLSRIPDSPVGGTTSSFSSSSSDPSVSSTSISSSRGSAISSTVSTSSSTSDSLTSSTASVTSISDISSTSSSSTTSAAPGTTVTIDVSSLSYIDGILLAHNIHRSNHTAQNLTWSSDLASIAAEIAATCYYEHNTTAGGGGYGQNIGAGQTPEQVPAMIGNSMYNTEMPSYPLPYGQDTIDMSNFDKWGHFSQVVWSATREVGCATQQCTNGVGNTQPNVAPYFTVCNYSPPGNIQGAYSQVGVPLGQPIVEITPS